MSLITLLFFKGENEPIKQHFILHVKCEMWVVEMNETKRRRICVLMFDSDGVDNTDDDDDDDIHKHFIHVVYAYVYIFI